MGGPSGPMLFSQVAAI
ncbi:DUF6053 domain-containing protein [Lysobacter enzymogenes]